MGKSGCAVYRCRPSPDSSRHSFPDPGKNVALFALWMNAIGNLVLRYLPNKEIYERYRVCRKHFSPEDVDIRGRLKRGAFPKLYLPNHIPEVPAVIDDDHIQMFHNYARPVSEHTMEDPVPAEGSILQPLNVRNVAELSPKAAKLCRTATEFKRKMLYLKKRNANLKRKLKKNNSKNSLKQCLKTVASNFTSYVRDFFQNQLDNCSKKPKGRRYTLKDKLMSLALMKQSSSAYKVLRRIFCLPSKITLSRLLNRIKIEPGVHTEVFDGLESLSKKLPTIKRHCVLMFDEMHLRPHLQANFRSGKIEGLVDYGHRQGKNIAKNAQVYMLRGVEGSWKQPVAYQFVKDGARPEDIVKTIKTIVKLAKKAGFKIVATVCDQGTNNSKALKMLLNETRNKYARSGKELKDNIFEIENEKIFPLYDTPHLLKGLRNNLLQHNIIFEMNGETMVAKWEHIENAWRADCFSSELRAMPKLTSHHVEIGQIRKMKVSVCAQTFSHTVASVINLLAGNGIDTKAKETARFVNFIDKLFDAVNGTANFDKIGKPLRTSMRLDRPDIHLDFWKQAIPILKSMKIQNKRSMPPTFTNWIFTLENFIKLSFELRNLGHKFFKTRNFQQDALENFFGRLRQKGHRNVNPTVTSFMGNYKSALVNTMVAKHSLGANCEMDKGNILLTLQHFFKEKSESNDNKRDSDYVYTVPENLKIFSTMEKRAVAYVTGYLAKIKSKFHRTCNICKFNLLGLEENTGDIIYDLNKAKEYDNRRRLVYCKKSLINKLGSVYISIKYLLSNHLEDGNCLATIRKFVFNNSRLQFANCIHKQQVEGKLLLGIYKLTIHNYLNSINKIMNGKETRALPQTCASIFKEAKHIFEKRYRKRNK